ncbi:hypothetical protein ABG067_007751 [Albugo candida]
MSYLSNILHPLKEADNNDTDEIGSISSEEDNISSPRQLPVKRRLIATNDKENAATDEANSSNVIDTTNTSRPAEIHRYVKLKEKIEALQKKFDEKYEAFVVINGAEALEDKTKVKNNIEMLKRFDLIARDLKLTCLRVKKREILYPNLLEREGIVDCKQFVDNKLKILSLETETSKTTSKKKAKQPTKKKIKQPKKKITSQERVEKRKAVLSKAGKVYFKKKKGDILPKAKIHRFKLSVKSAIESANNYSEVLAILFEKELEKWETVPGNFTIPQAMRLCYTHASSFIVNNGQFLKVEVEPKVVRLARFPGAKEFFDSKRLLPLINQPLPTQDLISKFCLIFDKEKSPVRDSLVFFTALLISFLPVFPFNDKYKSKLGFKYLPSFSEDASLQPGELLEEEEEDEEREYDGLMEESD